MLRGPQTPGELKQRTERMHRFGELADVHGTLDELGRRELVERLERRPGQKEERYRHLLGEVAPVASGSTPTSPPAAGIGDLDERVEALEAEVRRLRAELDALHSGLSA
jgi:uncharacterized protein YceH (UPF0502 family)